ncbi:MAG: (2Fe-2S)-binding protein [Myxococcota bacterium]
MLVCHCKQVSCTVIRDCVQAGARSTNAVEEFCGAGTGCGGCRPLVKELVERELGSTGPLDGIPMARADEA